MTDNFLIFYIVFGCIGLVILFFLTRWLFAIDKQLKNQKAMVRLLIKLCRKQGVAEKELEEIKSELK